MTYFIYELKFLATASFSKGCLMKECSFIRWYIKHEIACSFMSYHDIKHQSEVCTTLGHGDNTLAFVEVIIFIVCIWSRDFWNGIFWTEKFNIASKSACILLCESFNKNSKHSTKLLLPLINLMWGHLLASGFRGEMYAHWLLPKRDSNITLENEIKRGLISKLKQFGIVSMWHATKLLDLNTDKSLLK